MKFKKTMLASGIIAAALAVSTAAYAVTNEQEAEQRWAERDAKISARLLDEEAERADNGLTAFEEAILRGESPYDFRNADYDKQTASGEIIRFDNTPKFADSASGCEITPVHGMEGGGYYLWTGNFRVPSVSEFVKTYSANYFDCTCSEKSAGMTATGGFAGNYKTMSVRLTFLKDGKTNYVSDRADWTQGTVALNDLSCGEGELVAATYYFCLHAGTGQNAPLYEVVSVNVVDDDFAETALYKESISAK